MMDNKRGVILLPVVGILILAITAVVILVMVGIVAFSNLFTIIGVVIILGTIFTIAPAALRGDLSRQKVVFVMLFLVIGGGMIFAERSDFIDQQIFGFVEQSAFPGFSTLSLSQVDLKSSSPFLDGQQWVMTVRQGGLAQEARGVWSTKDVGDLWQGAESPANGFSVSLDYAAQQCEYKIIQDRNLGVISKYNAKEWGCFEFTLTEAEAREKCNSGNLRAFGKLPRSFTCVCVEELRQINSVGFFENPSIRAVLDVSVSSAGQVFTRRIDTLGETRGPLGPNGYVVWQGNLDTGTQCVSQASFSPMFYQGKWQTFSKARLDDYRTSKILLDNAIVRGEATASSGTWDGIVSSVGTVNSKVSGLINSRTTTFGTLVRSTNLNNALAVVSLQSPSAFPVLTFYIKAAWMGIFTPVAKPAIVGTGSSCFRTGAGGFINANIKNIGSEGGAIEVWATCSSPFTVTARRDVFLQAGQVQQVTLPLSATTDQTELKASCTVFAKGVAETVSSGVQACVESPPTPCVPNEIWCEGNNIMNCDSTGQRFEAVKTCSTECIRNDKFTAFCKEVPGEEGCSTDSDCGSEEKCLAGKCVTTGGGKENCKSYQELSQKEKCPSLQILCDTKLVKPEIISKCRTKPSILLGVLGAVVLVVGSLFLIPKKGKRMKKRRKK